jgi:hypothetical protein
MPCSFVQTIYNNKIYPYYCATSCYLLNDGNICNITSVLGGKTYFKNIKPTININGFDNIINGDSLFDDVSNGKNSPYGGQKGIKGSYNVVKNITHVTGIEILNITYIEGKNATQPGASGAGNLQVTYFKPGTKLFYSSWDNNICNYTQNAYGADGMISLTFIADIEQKNHTNIYNEYWKNVENPNNNYQFYDPNTFGVNIYKNPCKVIKYNKNFLNTINQNIKCKGKWCINDIFGNCQGNARNCYEVEHIIDKGGPHLPGYCKNIAANLVMAWGKWNSQLGNMARYDYNASYEEKHEIYGETMISKVIDAILD